MIYRETGQFKTTYESDQQLFPILQDRVFVIGFLLFAFVAVPFIATDYLFRAILTPFLILSLAALGLNILVGYCGQLSLGTGGFMAVGAYAAYNLAIRVPDLNLVVVFILAGLCSTVVGALFGIPSLRIKGFYLAVTTSPPSSSSIGSLRAWAGSRIIRPPARSRLRRSSCSAT